LEGATGSGDVHQRIHFEAACLGFSGGPHDKEALTREAVRARHYLIANDAHIALTGATGGEPGVIAIAGTGSIAYGRNAAGKTARAGGWGYIFGDEGGAFDLVRQALRAILRHDEGWGAATSLRDTLLHATGARDGNDLLHRFYTLDFPRSRVASYAPLIDEAAREGDHVAREILMSGAQALATYVAAVRRQLFQRGEPSHTSYGRAVFRRMNAAVAFEFDDQAKAFAKQFAGEDASDVGALLEAYKLGGVHEIAHGDHAGL
jgi:N-acetylglucosamine kinase-like BadF-type ATPase